MPSLLRFSFCVCILVHHPSFSGFFPPFFSKVAAEGSGEGAMCFRAGAKAPVCSGWAPAVGQGSPGGTREVRMGLGQGVTKDVDRDGPGQPLVRLRMGPVLLCKWLLLGRGLPRHACAQELAEEPIKGHSAGSCLQQETVRPTARKNRLEPSPTRRAASTWLRELAASVGCMCEPPCIWEALWDSKHRG